MVAAKVCLVASLIALGIYLYGVLVTITTSEKNNCKMTYMFEYPQFVVSKNYERRKKIFRFPYARSNAVGLDD